VVGGSRAEAHGVVDAVRAGGSLAGRSRLTAAAALDKLWAWGNLSAPARRTWRSSPVHIGARVSALAGPGEVLVSRTVKDLVAGSGIRFVGRGTHALKGITEDWQLLAAAA
jgi:hypothetical protein